MLFDRLHQCVTQVAVFHKLTVFMTGANDITLRETDFLWQKKSGRNRQLNAIAYQPTVGLTLFV